jgi:predicted CXXCH cytochrome family protein
MTQRATPDAFLAPPPSSEQPIVLTTGSHHYQAYWTRGERPGELALLPFVYLAHDRRFVPRRSVFLTPEEAPPTPVAWSASCIQCHAVAGRPRRDELGTRFDSDVVEIGIACEACHGPGAEHAEGKRNPVVRALAHGSAERDRTIVNPKKLDAAGSSAVCAQCHSLSFPRDEHAFWDVGTVGPRPDKPFETRELLTYERLGQGGGVQVDAPRENLFWSDGTIRVGGREANAHFLSPCYARGAGDRQLSCVSCHSMHASEPNDQLAKGMDGNGACTSCHEPIAATGSDHTHHATGSPGSECQACHMPKTTFALLGAIRSHRIEKPSLERARQSGRLPACNLCHLDRSVAWTGEWLGRWYGSRAEPRASDAESSAIHWLLAGNATERALAADHFGDPAAKNASGARWSAPLLARLLDDPYAAVRYVAARSLRSLPEFRDLEYDFVGDPALRRGVAAQVEKRWREAGGGGGTLVPSDQRPRVLLDKDGASDVAAIARLTSQRDDRAITIAE